MTATERWGARDTDDLASKIAGAATPEERARREAEAVETLAQQAESETDARRLVEALVARTKALTPKPAPENPPAPDDPNTALLQEFLAAAALGGE